MLSGLIGGNILRYNKFSFACFLWLINDQVWLLRNTIKKCNTFNVSLFFFLSTHCVIFGLHQIFSMSSHWGAHRGSVWSFGRCNGTFVPFPFPVCTWLLQRCTGKMLLTNCSLQETGVLEHVSFVASLPSLSAHMGGSLPQSGTATCCSTFFFPRHGLLFFLTLQNTFSFFSFFLLGYSWCIL